MSAVASALPDRAYESHAFALWHDLLHECGGRRVVDFGHLRPGTLSHFSECAVNLDVVAFDLDALDAVREDAEGEPTPKAALAELDRQLPRLNAAGELHGALAWDIPNFLGRDELSKMGDWLAHYCATGAPLFVALATRGQMPSRAASYQVVDERHLALRSSDGSASAPMYSQNDLKRVWPDFDVVRSFLLQDGRQEYVLRRY